MSKNYQKAARGWLYALAAVIAGTCFSASPAQSATCFLPSGECSTGKIGAGPSGGESTPEYCIGYNVTEKEYNAKYKNTSCFICSSPCTKTSGGTFYKCEAINNTTWYDKYNVCCTDGTKYDADDGKCCAGGKCDHLCPAGKQWSPTFKQCVCPSSVETDKDGNCCAAGQVLDNGVCTTPCTMNDCGDYPYTSDPGNSEYCDLGCGKGMRYKCRDGYTYSGGKCVEKCAASGYTLTSAKDSNCYSCSTCPTDSSKYKCTESVKTGYQLSGNTCVYKCSDYTLTSKKDENCYSCSSCQYDTSKYKCTENVQSGYQLVNGVCSKKPVEKVTITITLEYDYKSSGSGYSGSSSSLIKFTNTASDGKSYTVKLIINGSGDDGINYPLTVTSGNWVTYSSSYWETSDNDYGGNGDDRDTSTASTASDMSVVINNQTVKNGLSVTSLAGKTYTTDNYIIKFAEASKVQEPTSYTITVTDTITKNVRTDYTTYKRTVKSNDSSVTIDVISRGIAVGTRCDQDCECHEEGSNYIDLKNGTSSSYWDTNIDSGGCDVTTTSLSWKYTTIKIGSSEQTFNYTQCKETTINYGGKTYKIVCEENYTNVNN